VENGFFGVTI